MVRALFFTCLILMFQTGTRLLAQDPQFSQFYANPVNLNPTLVGIAGQSRVIAIHRQQGTRITGFRTSSFSMDSPLGQSSGWGVQAIHDSQMNGLINTISFHASLAHRMNISDNAQLGMGIRLGLYQKTLDWDKLIFEDQLDDRMGIVNQTNETFGRNRITNGDISVGMVYYSPDLFAGATISHVNRPLENFNTESDIRLPIRYTLHAGGFLRMGNYRRNEHVLSPNVIFERQGEFSYWHLGMYYGTEVWTAGAWYRWGDAVVMSLGVNISRFRLGYSYDMPVAAYKANSASAHELSVAWQFQLISNKKIKNRYKGKCPSFQRYLF